MEFYNTLIIKSESKEILKKIHKLFINKIINKDLSRLFLEEPILASALTLAQVKKLKEGKFNTEKHLNCGSIFADEPEINNTLDTILRKETKSKQELFTITISFDSEKIIDNLVKLISKTYKVVIYQEWESLTDKNAGYQHYINGKKDWPYHYGTKISLRIDKSSYIFKDDRGFTKVDAKKGVKISLKYLMDEYDITNDPMYFKDAYEGECDNYLKKENLDKINDSLESGNWEWLEKIVFTV